MTRKNPPLPAWIGKPCMEPGCTEPAMYSLPTKPLSPYCQGHIHEAISRANDDPVVQLLQAIDFAETQQEAVEVLAAGRDACLSSSTVSQGLRL